MVTLGLHSGRPHAHRPVGRRSPAWAYGRSSSQAPCVHAGLLGHRGESQQHADEELVSQAFHPLYSSETGFREKWLARVTWWGGEESRNWDPALKTEAALLLVQEVRGLNVATFKITSSLCLPPTTHLPAGRVRKETFPLRCSCHFFRAHLHDPVSVLRPPSLGVIMGVTLAGPGGGRGKLRVAGFVPC